MYDDAHESGIDLRQKEYMLELVKFCPLEHIMKLCTSYFVAKRDMLVIDGVQSCHAVDDEEIDGNEEDSEQEGEKIM
eukprot:8117698-Ditylum_brightwellii.AAC.1